MIKKTTLPFMIVLLLMGCSRWFVKKYSIDFNATVHNVKYAGVRSSSYGIKPFPDPAGWETAMNTMQDYFPGSTPCAIWIVGRMHKSTSCLLEFPSEGKEYENVVFLDYDKHESYLNHFDQAGIKVFLQVEPANADITTLIDLILSRYEHHDCVIGFGIDVE